VAFLLRGVQLDQWRRPGRRSDGAVFTVETFARYVVYDPARHLWDVDAGCERYVRPSWTRDAWGLMPEPSRSGNCRAVVSACRLCVSM
jgi:hypothetical protein